MLRPTARVVSALAGLAALFATACEEPQVVNCRSVGVMNASFVEAGGDFWCIYPRLITDPDCPAQLPVEHDLPWGGKGCASREHRPLPPDLCAAAGACAADGGTP